MKYLVLISLLFVFSVLTVAQDQQAALLEMVKTEQEFSKTAEVKTTREAFLEFIASDGLLFRPGAVNGKKWMEEHPVPPSTSRGLLTWQPTFAGMATSADFGFTTGPWQSKPDVNDLKPSAFGHFVTVWKKQADGSWKFAVDLGISHPMPDGPQVVMMTAPVVATPNFKAVEVATERKTLLDVDRKLAKDKNAATAFFANAEPDVRVYRNGHFPQVGKQAAEKILIPANSQMKWQPLDSDVAKSGDVGYTRGTYDVIDRSKKVIDNGSYVRIWRKQRGIWKIVIDVVNPHQ